MGMSGKRDSNQCIRNDNTFLSHFNMLKSFNYIRFVQCECIARRNGIEYLETIEGENEKSEKYIFGTCIFLCGFILASSINKPFMFLCSLSKTIKVSPFVAKREAYM